MTFFDAKVFIPLESLMVFLGTVLTRAIFLSKETYFDRVFVAQSQKQAYSRHFTYINGPIWEGGLYRRLGRIFFDIVSVIRLCDIYYFFREATVLHISLDSRDVKRFYQQGFAQG